MEPTVTMPRRVSYPIMGTVASLHVYTPHTTKAAIQRASHDVFEELERIEAIFSTFRNESAISRINRGEIDISDAPREVADVLDACTWLERKSDGVFSAFRSRNSPCIDPAGFVKGWAAERSAQCLHRHGLRDWYLSVGGDIIMAGEPAPGRRWSTAIVDPHNAQRIVANITLPAGAVATSGASQRGNHIYNGDRSAVEPHFASVTVVGPSLAWADAFATTVYAMGESGLPWIKQFTDYQAIAHLGPRPAANRPR